MDALNDMLKASAWARQLSPEEIERVQAGIAVRTVPAGAFVCMKGDAVDAWMGIVDGLVKIASNWSTGKTTTFTGVPTGGWFGEGSLLKNEPRRYDVMALRESRVAYMNRATFQWLLDHSLAFNRFLIIQLNERLGQFIGMMENERLLDIDARLARCLASMFNPVLYPGSSRELQISQEEIGFLAGVSRQRVNQALRKLEDAGLLRLDYGSITILDLPGLRCFGE
jgi:CRP/FNR family transcriptional regulator, cyclic AMP receptor protein